MSSMSSPSGQRGGSRNAALPFFTHNPYVAKVLQPPLVDSPAAILAKANAVLPAAVANFSFTSAASSGICASDVPGLSQVTSPDEAPLISFHDGKVPPSDDPEVHPSRVVPTVVPLEPPATVGRAFYVRVQLNKYSCVVARCTIPCVHPRNAAEAPVIVYGDRGEDMGFVMGTVDRISKNDRTEATSVLRLPTRGEVEQYYRQRDVDEPQALDKLRSLARDVRFEGVIEGALYQWDKKKLTLYISRTHRRQFLDFRKLQRAAFQHFQCRIWMVYMDEL